MPYILFPFCVCTNLLFGFIFYLETALFIYFFNAQFWKIQNHSNLFILTSAPFSVFLLDHCFSFSFSSEIWSCSALLVCDSEFYGWSFLTTSSLHLSSFPVFKALAFHSLSSQSELKLPVLIRLVLATLLISSSRFLTPLLFL